MLASMIEDFLDVDVYARRKRRRAFIVRWGGILVVAALAAMFLPEILRSTFGPKKPRSQLGGSQPGGGRSQQAAPSDDSNEISRVVKVEAGIRKTYRVVEKDGQFQIIVEEAVPEE